MECSINHLYNYNKLNHHNYAVKILTQLMPLQ